MSQKNKRRTPPPSSKLEARSSSGVRARKSLGQHFLSSPSYLKAIVDAANIQQGDAVVEIGPGKGSLTAELLSRGARVIAVEKDHRLIPLLKEKFSREISDRQLQIVESDALLFDPAFYKLRANNYKLLGNIPYYITGALFQKFLSEAPRPQTLVFLIQKEVAERIARSKKESILSLSIKAYGEPQYIKTVPRGAFSPTPKVDSAILSIEHISADNFTNPEHEKWFFELVRTGFAHKRKLLVRNLEKILGARAKETLALAHIPENARAEDVSLEKWLALSKNSIKAV